MVRPTDVIKWFLILAGLAFVAIIGNKAITNLSDYIWEMFKQHLLGREASQEAE